MGSVMFWLILAAALLVIEAVTVGLTTIWFAGGAFIAGIAALLGAGFFWQLILFLAVSLGLLFFTRPWALRYLNRKVEKTNVDSLIGGNAKVIQKINNLQETGKVMVRGMEWTARAEDDNQEIREETIVRIKAVKGVKLIVAEQKKDEEKEDCL